MPAPALVSLPAPEIVPAKTVSPGWSTVRSPLPSAIVPAVPRSPARVWLLPLRSKVPPVMASIPVEARLPPEPSRSVPASISVPPV